MAELGPGGLLVPRMGCVCMQQRQDNSVNIVYDLHGLEFLVKYVKPSRRDRLLRVSLLVHFRSRDPKAVMSAKNF
jgi:hypothetical protein